MRLLLVTEARRDLGLLQNYDPNLQRTRAFSSTPSMVDVIVNH